MNEEQDKELIRRTLQGETKAFEILVRKYQQSIMNYIGRMVRERETAIDFTQDVFVRAYSSLRSFDPTHKFTTWLFRIASNLVIDHWRKKKIQALSLSEPADEDRGPALDIPDNEPSVARKFELAELRRRIEKALERLPTSQRELFIWRHVNGLSYEEMAEIKSLPLGTVKNRVYQAKETIRRLLEESS
ncbi:MAG: sigma-70 family RNA polymerase sigma factor [Clostridiales bacterium]|jgi:RNA polymerase sigma-70 factor (ECF subfamily)|nr:sigma-70 family RNA polymerase sigma factor [Clostridiales bacterium]